MSIKCSILGHRFGETQVERDREEDGTEVVITITELENCTRCDETRVVSENKEVTTMEAAPGTDDSDEAATAGAGSDAAAETSERVGSDSGSTGGRDAEFVDETAPDSNAQAEARSAPATIPDAESGSAGESAATDDDAVIIDDGEPADASGAGNDAPGGGTADGDSADDGADGSDESPEERSPGEWPEEPEGVDPAERAGETAEVEILGSDDGTDDASDAADRTDAAGRSDPESGVDQSDVAAGTDAVGETSAGEDYGGREEGVESASAGDAAAGAATGTVDAPASGDEAWPQDEDDSTLRAGEEAMGDWPEETKRDEPADPRAAGPSLDGDDSPSITVPEGMFKCPECGFTTEVESSSLRAGDFCPECRSGTLAQAPDDDEE